MRVMGIESSCDETAVAVYDLQHGLLDYGDLRHMLPAISTTETTPIVRVAGNDPASIMRCWTPGRWG